MNITSKRTRVLQHGMRQLDCIAFPGKTVFPLFHATETVVTQRLLRRAVDEMKRLFARVLHVVMRLVHCCAQSAGCVHLIGNNVAIMLRFMRDTNMM